MKTKEYNFFKTANKTAKENNLIIADRAISKDSYRIFDFSELDNIKDISEDEKNHIKNEALKHVCSAFNSLYYGKEFDSFHYCDGMADFYCHRVFDKHGKLLYRIFQLVKINHKSFDRTSIYKNYTMTSTIFISEWDKPTLDYEI